MTDTNEKMAAKLRAARWRVEEPLTKDNCKHPFIQGSGGTSWDGSGFTESWCPACGYQCRNEWGSQAKLAPSIGVKS